MSYIKLDQSRTVMVDIDDTIILWEPEKYKHHSADLININDYTRQFQFLQHKRHIDFLWKLKCQGYGIVFWSAAGVNWVENVVQRLELTELPDFIMSKPEFALDDFLDARKIIKQVIWINPDDGKFMRSE